MEKRGQITIFIIIAIILIASVSLFFVLRDKLGSSRFNNDPVYFFIESCIEDSGKDAIYYIIKNGGYMNQIPLSTSEGVPYYYYANKNYVPSRGRIEKEISLYVEESLGYCTGNFSNFPDSNIIVGDIEASTTIEDEEVIFDVKFPVVVEKEESVTRFKDFRDIKVIVRIGGLHDSIERMIQGQVGEEEICLSCMFELADREGFTIDMTNVEEGLIFVIGDEYSKIKDVPLEWRFANKY